MLLELKLEHNIDCANSSRFDKRIFGCMQFPLNDALTMAANQYQYQRLSTRFAVLSFCSVSARASWTIDGMLIPWKARKKSNHFHKTDFQVCGDAPAFWPLRLPPYWPSQSTLCDTNRTQSHWTFAPGFFRPPAISQRATTIAPAPYWDQDRLWFSAGNFHFAFFHLARPRFSICSENYSPPIRKRLILCLKRFEIPLLSDAKIECAFFDEHWLPSKISSKYFFIGHVLSLMACSVKSGSLNCQLKPPLVSELT